MQSAPYPDVPPDFGHWLAGFIDGEASFIINRNGGYKRNPDYVRYSPRMNLRLRDDDRAVLETIRSTTGLGLVRASPLYEGASPNARPQAQWIVIHKRDCARLVELLDRFPPRSKKARDYAIWREAVTVWASMPRNRRIDWSPLKRLHGELIAARAYHAASS